MTETPLYTPREFVPANHIDVSGPNVSRCQQFAQDMPRRRNRLRWRLIVGLLTLRHFPELPRVPARGPQDHGNA